MNQRAAILPTLCFAALLLQAADVPAAPSLNLPEAFADTKSILANNDQADIIIFGDSLTMNSPGGFLPFFRQLMQDQYGNAGIGYRGFNGATGVLTHQGWLEDGLSTDMQPYHSLDGLWEQSSLPPYPITGQDNTARFTAASPDTQLHFMTQPNGGHFEIYLPRQEYTPLATIDTRGLDQQVTTWSYTFTDTSQPMQYIVKPLGDGPVTLLGHNQTNNYPGVRIHRASNGGWGIDNFLHRDSTFDQQLQLINPDLLMIALGTNDFIYNQQTYQPKLNDFIDRLQMAAPDADIVLISSYDRGASTDYQRAAAMQQVATDRHIGFINLFEAAGSCNYFRSNGYIKTDNVHFTESGGQYVAQFLFNAFQSDGQTLTEKPCIDGDINCDGSVDLLDLTTLSENYYNQCIIADVNCDGYVNLLDLTIIAENFNKSNKTPQQGDLDNDGFVGLLDLTILSENYGRHIFGYTSGQPLCGDLNCDGIVDLVDLTILGENYGRSKPSPEPTSLALLTITLVATTSRRR